MVSEENRLSKKREVLPMLDAVIGKLTKMAADCAKLEYYDNDQASRRIKLDIIDLRDNEMKNFHRFILSIREEINQKYNKSKKQRKDEHNQTV
jgi:hypothetical protein